MKPTSEMITENWQSFWSKKIWQSPQWNLQHQGRLLRWSQIQKDHQQFWRGRLLHIVMKRRFMQGVSGRSTGYLYGIFKGNGRGHGQGMHRSLQCRYRNRGYRNNGKYWSIQSGCFRSGTGVFCNWSKGEIQSYYIELEPQPTRLAYKLAVAKEIYDELMKRISWSLVGIIL